MAMLVRYVDERGLMRERGLFQERKPTDPVVPATDEEINGALLIELGVEPPIKPQGDSPGEDA
jgi:hypothetical protein